MRLFKWLSGMCLVLCGSLELSAQQFQWVYAIEAEEAMNRQDSIWPTSGIFRATVAADNAIFAIGHHNGYHTFPVNGEDVVYGTAASATDDFLLKLDRDKNLHLALKFRGVFFHEVLTDQSGHVYVIGRKEPGLNQDKLYLDPYPPASGLPILNPTHENLDPDELYYFLAKFDSDGHYLGSLLEDELYYIAMAVAPNEDVIIGGSFRNGNGAYIARFDNGMNLLWEKTFDAGSRIRSLDCDASGALYFQVDFEDSFTFAGQTLQHPSGSPSFSEAVGRIGPGGTEDWIVDLHTQPENERSRNIKTDASGVYFYTQYTQAFSYGFPNATISGLPLSEDAETVLFKIDHAGNYLWHATLSGPQDQSVKSIAVNSLRETYVLLDTPFASFQYGTTPVSTSHAESVLLRINAAGALADVKRFEAEVTYSVAVGPDDHVVLAGLVTQTTDVDPHPFGQELLVSEPYDTSSATYDEHIGYILRLEPCESAPLFDATYTFCGGTFPHPTLGDIQPNDFNVQWFGSPTAATPLAPGTSIVSGQTYYYEKTTDNCPPLGRFPLRILVENPPGPPVPAPSQPCYSEGMKLTDLAVVGTNLSYYLSADDPLPLNPATGMVVPGRDYFVSQTVADCESPRIKVAVAEVALPDTFTAYYCGDAGTIDLSAYHAGYLPDGASVSDYAFSYHPTRQDAFDNRNPIATFAAYPASPQDVFVRVVPIAASCAHVITLSLQPGETPVIEQLVVRDLAPDNSITVLPSGLRYSLDGVSFQDSNRFDGLAAGRHTVFIQSGQGCAGSPMEVFILAYPKFFTPNGDGVNDFWRIDFAIFQEALDVAIYDRYGKLITAFGKSASGWDGTYKGRPLPADDYWFVITRDRATVSKGHFSLVR